MNPLLLVSVTASVVLAVIFVWLNMWAVQPRLEETFVTLALFYGLLTIVVNAVFMSLAVKQRSA